MCVCERARVCGCVCVSAPRVCVCLGREWATTTLNRRAAQGFGGGEQLYR